MRCGAGRRVCVYFTGLTRGAGCTAGLQRRMPRIAPSTRDEIRDTEVLMDNLGSRLKDLRLKAGMTLRQLARQAELSPSFVSQIENGKSQPSVATLYSFAQLLNV